MLSNLNLVAKVDRMTQASLKLNLIVHPRSEQQHNKTWEKTNNESPSFLLNVSSCIPNLGFHDAHPLLKV